MIEISPHSHVHIPPFLLEKEGSLNLLIHPEKPVWMVVNDLGLEVVKLGEEGLTLAEISKVISVRYGVEQKKVDHDMITFFQKLDQAGFLEKPDLPSYKPSLRSLFLHLTNRCNLTCKHCYVGGASENGEMDTSTIFSLIDQLVSLGGSSITLSGGEPLIRKDIKEILSYAGERLTIRFLTNGTFLNESLAQFMVRLGIHIQVSLDGSNALIHELVRGKGTFSKVLKNIRLLKEVGIGDKLNLCTAIMKFNIKDIPRIIELAEELSINYVRFLPLRRVGRARQLWDNINADVGIKDYESLYEYIFYRAMKEHPALEISSGLSGFVLSAAKNEPSGIWCPIGKYIVITAQGECYPCLLFMTEEYHLGNIKENTLAQICESQILKELTASLQERKSMIEKCKKCTWKSFCQGGCMGMAKEYKGTIFDTDPFCTFRKKLYRKTIFELATRKLSQKAGSEDCF